MVDHIGKRVTQFLAAIAQNRQLSPQRRRDWLADKCQRTVRNFGSRLNVSP